MSWTDITSLDRQQLLKQTILTKLFRRRCKLSRTKKIRGEIYNTLFNLTITWAKPKFKPKICAHALVVSIKAKSVNQLNGRLRHARVNFGPTYPNVGHFPFKDYWYQVHPKANYQTWAIKSEFYPSCFPNIFPIFHRFLFPNYFYF